MSSLFAMSLRSVLCYTSYERPTSRCTTRTEMTRNHRIKLMNMFAQRSYSIYFCTFGRCIFKINFVVVLLFRLVGVFLWVFCLVFFIN